MKLINVVTSVIFTFAFLFSFGQMTSGTIKFKLDVEGDTPEVERMRGNMAESKIEVSFNQDAFRVQTTINSESVNTSLIHKKSGEVLVTIRKADLKVAYVSNLSEMVDLAPKVNALKFTGETKTILGHKCKKATAVDPAGNSIYYWYTEEISYGIDTYQVPVEIPGVCLEYAIFAGPNKIIYIAADISEDAPDAGLFDLTIPEGYNIHRTEKKGEGDDIEIRKKPEEDTPVETVPDIAPTEKLSEVAQFPGGETEMMKFIRAEVNYPKESNAEGSHGTVYIQFIVEKNGSLTALQIAKGVSEAFDNEAIRLVKSMPNWIPAKQAGKSVRSKYTLPINFRLK